MINFFSSLCVAFFLLFYISALDAFTIHREQLLHLVSQPAPEWMQKQIAADLQPFQERGVSQRDLDETIRNVYAVPGGHGANFVRYKIHNNRISWTSPSESGNDDRIKHFLEFVEEAARIIRFPDVEFIVSLWDSFDRPVYLMQTSAPIFAICKYRHNSKAVLFPEVRNFSYRERIFNDIRNALSTYPWDRKAEKAFWRGMTSGGYYPFYEWDYKPRSRLVLFSKSRPNLVDARFSSPYYLDPPLKEWMERYGLFTEWIYPVPFLAYKYLISIDGNTFASNLSWQLLSNSVVLKGNSDFIEWYYGAIEPYVHYVPFEQDLSDLERQLAWIQGHDEEARQIAENASRFAQEHLSNESLIFYLYTLLNAYALLQRNL